MSIKTLKISSIAAAIAIGLGVSAVGQAAVVVVTGHHPHPQVRCVQKQGYMVCYEGGYEHRYYAKSTERVCDSHGICHWRKCYITPYQGKQCYDVYPNHRVY